MRLLSVRNDYARAFYEAEALRGGWTIRQLTRQIETQFYERTALSKNKVARLAKGAKRMPDDAVSAEEELKDHRKELPRVLKLGLTTRALQKRGAKRATMYSVG